MNKSFATAKEKGILAAWAGEPETACPYSDKRTPTHNHVTFSRAFRRAWLDGHRYWTEKYGLGKEKP
jgi:hypothetical protein